MSCHGNRPSMEVGSWAEEVKEHCDRQQDGSNNNSLENKEYKTNNVFYPLMDNKISTKDRNKFWKDKPIKQEIEVLEIADDKD